LTCWPSLRGGWCFVGPAHGFTLAWAVYWGEVSGVRQRYRVVLRESFVYNPRLVDLGLRLWARALLEALFREGAPASGGKPEPVAAQETRAAAAGG
jgi:hypothetical protein